MPLAATWMDLELNILTEDSQRQIYHFYLESKKIQEFPGSLVIRDLALSLLWYGFPGLETCTCHRHSQKTTQNKQKKNKVKKKITQMNLFTEQKQTYIHGKPIYGY